MIVEGPEIYTVTFDSTAFSIRSAGGPTKYGPLARSRLPKLYVASIEYQPVYVGITKQPLQTRLGIGWRATGKKGYYGYRWRHHGPTASLAVWAHLNSDEHSLRDIEIVEAEVVHLVRLKLGQWPKHQTEIHFWESDERHRETACRVYSDLTANGSDIRNP